MKKFDDEKYFFGKKWQLCELKLCTHDQDLRIRKFCIREQKYFLLCVHMAFKDQQNLSKVEILLYQSNSYFLELRTCLNILI